MFDFFLIFFFFCERENKIYILNKLSCVCLPFHSLSCLHEQTNGMSFITLIIYIRNINKIDIDMAG